MKPPHTAPRALLASLTLCAATLAATACTSRAPAEPARPVAAPPAPAPVAPPVTSDRGNRTILPSPIGQLAPEDVPSAPPSGR